MQPPVAVPANGGPLMLALVTRPEGAKVMTTLATPEGSPSLRHADACAALAVRAVAAAARSNGPAGSPGTAGSIGLFGSSLATGGSGLGSVGAAGPGFSPAVGVSADVGLSRVAAGTTAGFVGVVSNVTSSAAVGAGASVTAAGAAASGGAAGVWAAGGVVTG